MYRMDGADAIVFSDGSVTNFGSSEEFMTTNAAMRSEYYRTEPWHAGG